MPTYSHWSDRPLEFPLQYRNHVPLGNLKPNGLWYEVDSDWENWVKANYPSWKIEKKLKTLLDLSAVSILRITTPEQLFKFHQAFKIKSFGESFHSISWPLVMAQFDGIEISPYQWDYRLAPEFHWYYGWDCASGCIWDATKVKSL